MISFFFFLSFLGSSVIPAEILEGGRGEIPTGFICSSLLFFILIVSFLLSKFYHFISSMDLQILTAGREYGHSHSSFSLRYKISINILPLLTSVTFRRPYSYTCPLLKNTMNLKSLWLLSVKPSHTLYSFRGCISLHTCNHNDRGKSNNRWRTAKSGRLFIF